MATKQKLEEEFFTCIICQDVFKDPVTLHCTHNFCASCLTSFTKTQPEAVTQGCLPCPSCRHLTKVPDSTRPVEEWAKQLKTGFFVKGLMEAIGTMDTTNEVSRDKQHCSVCKKEGKKTLASVWCVECNNYICESCQRKHCNSHAVSDIRGMGRSSGICEIHSEKAVEFYCSKCSSAICGICKSQNHKSCGNIMTITAAAKMVQPKLQERRNEIKTVIKRLKVASEETKQQFDQLTLKVTSIEDEIDKASQAVIDKVRAKAKQLKDEANVIKERQGDRISGLIKSLENEMENYEQGATAIDVTLQSSSDVEKMELYEKLPTVDLLKIQDKTEEVYIEFESFGQKLSETIEPLELGRLYTGNRKTNTVDTRKAKLHLKDEIDLQIPEDRETPFLRDVLATNISGTDVIIVADSGNKCVKSFYGKSQHSFLRLPAGPCKMTKISRTQGAVTISNKSVLVFTINPDVKNGSTISTRKNYYGIAWLGNSTFAAGGLSPVCIDIIDMTGTILRSLAHFVHENLVFWDFQTPVFLCTGPSGNIVVSDYSTRQVTILNKQLETEYKFPRLVPQEEGTLRNPLGVACSSNGDIFVVDRSREIVLQLSGEAKFIRNILAPKDGLEGATCIFIDEEDRLYLAVENRCVKKFSFLE